MSHETNQKSLANETSGTWWVAALVSTAVLAAVWAFASAWHPLVEGTLVSVILGVQVAAVRCAVHWQRQVQDRLDQLQAPIDLAQREGLAQIHCRFAAALSDVSRQDHSVLLEAAAARLAAMVHEAEQIATGRLEFSGTEAWRTIYDRLLSSLDVKVYYSVARVQTVDYWNDQPGRQSMELNYRLVDRGFRIERVLILPDALWPRAESQPTAEIRPWIDEQLQRGIQVRLAREQELHVEPDLLEDFGIYGTSAIGRLSVDDDGRTLNFTFDFNPIAVQEALRRWERLSLFTTPFPA